MPETLQSSDDFLTVRDVAKKLKLSSRYVYDLIRTGKGPPVKRFGTHIRISHSSFMKWASRPSKGNGHV